MKYNSLILFILLISPFIALSLNNIFSIWIIMELNLLMFLMYLIYNVNNSYEYSMKYFLISSFSSVLFLFSIIIMDFYMIEIYNIISNLVMFAKLGMYPFYYWFISMMKNLSWYSCMILLTWQKLIPMYLLMFVLIKYLLFILILINGLISVMYVMGEMNLKVILGYSSINHSCWLLTSLFISKLLWLFYFMTYFIIMFVLIYLLNFYNLMYIKDLFKNINSCLMPMIINGLMFSLGGLPAMFGFILKWNFFVVSMNYNLLYMLIFLVFFSLLFLYNYMRVIFIYMFDFSMNLKIVYLLPMKVYIFLIFLLMVVTLSLFMFLSMFLIIN